mmetsp:Transcript_62645/g.159305  ORF Transcript_62645/g.159305 Transcript_62645/m.159305 type:complete len:289 (-) Transcript_62645:70-936(-)
MLRDLHLRLRENHRLLTVRLKNPPWLHQLCDRVGRDVGSNVHRANLLVLGGHQRLADLHHEGHDVEPLERRPVEIPGHVDTLLQSLARIAETVDFVLSVCELVELRIYVDQLSGTIHHRVSPPPIALDEVLLLVVLEVREGQEQLVLLRLELRLGLGKLLFQQLLCRLLGLGLRGFGPRLAGARRARGSLLFFLSARAAAAAAPAGALRGLLLLRRLLGRLLRKATAPLAQRGLRPLPPLGTGGRRPPGPRQGRCAGAGGRERRSPNAPEALYPQAPESHQRRRRLHC